MSEGRLGTIGKVIPSEEDLFLRDVNTDMGLDVSRQVNQFHGVLTNIKVKLLQKGDRWYLNFVLNYQWIPKFGILGAAYATFASYAGFTLCIGFYSFRFLKFSIPYTKAGAYAFISLVMFVIVRIDLFDTMGVSLISKIFIGFLFYTSAVLAVDRDVRSKATMFVRRH